MMSERGDVRTTSIRQRTEMNSRKCEIEWTENFKLTQHSICLVIRSIGGRCLVHSLWHPIHLVSSHVRVVVALVVSTLGLLLDLNLNDKRKKYKMLFLNWSFGLNGYCYWRPIEVLL